MAGQQLQEAIQLYIYIQIILDKLFISLNILRFKSFNWQEIQCVVGIF